MKKSAYNLFFGLLNQIVLIIVGLLVPKLFMENFGSETNGLISSINQMFGYFNLLEAGIGAASLQALYEPVFKKNRKEINSIISATHRSYRKTAFYYLILVILVSLLFPKMVHTDMNSNIVSLIILVIGSTGVINFFYQGASKILLQAEGKDYIILNANSLVFIFSNIIKVYLINNGYNLILIQSIQSIFSLIQITYLVTYIRKNYSWINYKAKPNYNSISQRKSVLVHQIAGLIYNNTDILLLTAYTNLKIVSVYTVYNSITNMILQFIFQFSNSINHIFGKLLNTKSDKLIILFDAYEIVFLTLAFSIMNIINIVFIDFLKLYTNGIKDINYIDNLLGILFIIKILFQASRTPYRQIIDAAGHFSKTQGRAIIETIINFLISIYFVRKIGIYGVVLGSVVALIMRTIDMIHYTNIYILHRKVLKSITPWSSNMLIFIMLTIIGKWDFIEAESFPGLFLKTIIVSLIVFSIYCIVNYLLYSRIINEFLRNFKVSVLFKK